MSSDGSTVTFNRMLRSPRQTRRFSFWDRGKTVALAAIVAILAASLGAVTLAPAESARAATPTGYQSVPNWTVGTTSATTTLPGNASAFGTVSLSVPGERVVAGAGGWTEQGITVPRFLPTDAQITGAANCITNRAIGAVNNCFSDTVTITFPHAIVNPVLEFAVGGGGGGGGEWCTSTWQNLTFTGINGAAPSAGRITSTQLGASATFNGTQLSVSSAAVVANACGATGGGVSYLRFGGLVSSITMSSMFAATLTKNNNNAYVSGVPPTGGTGTNVLIPTADLSIAKSAPATVSSNGTITWTINVTNNGPAPSHGFIVRDAVPANVTGAALVSPPAGCTLTGTTLTCSEAPPGCTIAQNGTVATWADLTCAPPTAADTTVLGVGGSFGPITLTGIAPAARGTVVTNNATVSGADSDTNTANNTSTVNTTVTAPTLQVGKVVGGRVSAADQFTVTATNAGGTVVASTTTSGTATSSTSTAIQVVRGQTYTITDATAAGSANALSFYGASLVCTDTTTGAATPIPGTGPTWTFAPTAADAYACVVTNTPLTRAFTVAKTSSATSVAPGDTVTYTVTVTNTGDFGYTAASPASFTDDLAAVLDDATYNGDVSAGGSVTGTTLSWSGPLAVGASTTVTYSVTVNDPDAGDHVLHNVVLPDASTGGSCAAGGVCTTDTPVMSFTYQKMSNVSQASPGQTVTYTVTLKNTGGFAYSAASPATITDDLSGVLDDAAFNNDVTAGGSLAGNILTWSGPLAVGGTATITYSVTVDDPDTGDGLLANVVTSPNPGSSCSSPGDCVTDTPIASYTVSKTAAPAAAAQGGTVSYTVTVTNTGRLAYGAARPATFTDNLADVLDDGAYNGDVSAGGTVIGNTLTWSGTLAIGQTRTVTYSVTVDDAVTGNHMLGNVVIPTAPGGVCDPAGTCMTSTPIGSIRVVKSTTATDVNPGEVVPYTIAVTNTGRVPYTAADPASFTDDLSAVLDDATYNADAASTSGVGVSYAAPTLAWSGPLAVGATVTITYSVTVDNPITGDHRLNNTVVTPPGLGNCATGSTDPACSATVPASSFTIAKASSATTAIPGDVVTYSVTVTNTGNTAYTAGAPASFSDTLIRALDDATYNGDVSAGGTVTGTTLTWAGALAVGETVTVTYSLTIDTPDAGDHTLTNVVAPTAPGGGCDPAGTCATVTPVSTYSVAKSASSTTAVPGTTITYTVTVTNTGDVPYTAANPAAFTDDLSPVLDDATYNGDATAGAVVAGSTLTWSGPLAVGAAIAVTYSVTVDTPDTGDHILTNAVVPTRPGGACDPAATCSATTLVSSYTVTKTSSATTATPGSVITYAVTITNTGATSFTSAKPATFTDDLTAVLDDATYNGDVSTGGGVVANTLSWAGPLAVGAAVTVTYSVTVNTTGTGDHVLGNTVVPTGPGGTCGLVGTCVTTTPLMSYTVSKAASAATATPGSVITYTVTVANTGAAAYTATTPAAFSDDLSAVLDDAAYNGDVTAGGAVTGSTLSWSGPLAIGATLTVTYSVTVNVPDTGDHFLTNAVVPNGPGGSCAAPGTCATTTPVSSYAVTKNVSSTTTAPGAVITYTVTVTNTGATVYTGAAPAAFSDDLSAVLDDATYNGDVSGGGAVTGTTLHWSGALAVGASSIVTYSVTVDDPDTGDHILANAVVPSAPGGGCDPAGSCTTTTPMASFRVVKSSTSTAVVPGGVVPYTIIVTNTGQVDYTGADPASLSDDLSAVLDDATYNGDAVSSSGAGVAYMAPVLAWSGPLAIGATVTLTYSVTVNTPDAGDEQLTNTVVTPSGSGGNCDTGSTDPACTANVPAASYTVAKTASATTTIPGAVIGYTVTVVNTGKVAYTAASPASFADDLARVLDDATYNGDASVGGTVAGSTLTWAGALPVGATVTVTYSVTVTEPDTGDHILTNAVAPTSPGGSCDLGGTCATSTPVASYTLTKHADAVNAKSGQKVTYTVTVSNTGQVDYTTARPATFADDLSGVLDDAVYNGDVSTGGSVTGATLSWSGALAIGGIAQVTYSVTVRTPDAGDHNLANAVIPTDPGGSCVPTGSCVTSTPVKAYKVSKAVSSASARPGDKVTYTVTVTNTGKAAYTLADPASFTDDLTAALAHAGYNDDASNGAIYSAPVITWSGPLATGAVTTVSYSLTVNLGVGGSIRNLVVTPPGAGSNCSPASLDPACDTTTRIIPPSPGNSGLASTGSDILWLVLAGLALAGLGSALFFGARRRKRTEEDS
jgi:uncharacterized repeat protein (TIGR01451 family)/LPXTG-motif cell wall-anchored protein